MIVEPWSTGLQVDSVTTSGWLVRLMLPLWTIFVWGIVRLRNIVSDPVLDGIQMLGPLVLSASFWIPAVVLVIAIVWEWRRSGTESGSGAKVFIGRGLMALAAWTTLVWVYKVFDIVVLSDHPAAFVAVHVVLAVISVALAAVTVRSSRNGLGTASGVPQKNSQKAGI